MATPVDGSRLVSEDTHVPLSVWVSAQAESWSKSKSQELHEGDNQSVWKQKPKRQRLEMALEDARICEKEHRSGEDPLAKKVEETLREADT
jgi:hypothetical protein